VKDLASYAGLSAGRSLWLLALLIVSTAAAQEQSVNPGINKQFENRAVADFVPRFERDGRDPYDHRFEIVKAVGLKPGMVVADIGAGTGLFTQLFAPLVAPDGKVYAVDIAESFVKHIERQAAAEGLTNVKGVVCTADSVNLPAESIDLAFLCDVYHHFEFPQKTLASIQRALKPRGALVLIDFQRIEGVSSAFVMGHVRAGQEVFAKEVTDAGFKQVEDRKGLLSESYYLRFEKVDR
jgi:ubiquinone/menaquinone biosynthesis C-methylase UbiE